MSDHGRTDQTLALLAKPGVYEVLHVMHDRGGTATFAQIAAEARRALSLLRSLAAEGFVISARCGSLDIEPSAQAYFSLTAKGEAVAGHLTRLQQWITNRPARRDGQRPAR
jgi:DNA-binding HxlR family transcriptional regulator